MHRTIPESLSPILEDLELDRPQLVSLADLRAMCERHRIGTDPRVVASRLKQKGWLIATPQRGVWEFAPAELAGSYSSADPLLALKAFNVAHPECRNALRGQSAAWALGLADRAPSMISVAFEEQPKVKVPSELATATFSAQAPVRSAKGVSALGPASIVAQMAERPSSVRSWQSVVEWLPDVAFEIDGSELLKELEGRPNSVAQRTGYLLQGMRPDLAAAVAGAHAAQAVAKMGTSEAPIRYDQNWMVSDALLPFDPRELEALK
ncbi:type IV toxin-antitoxin system AbiEi family antitoxin [Adlercreutzia sp. R25]|uniref:Type IV toxin-antitoxin system AbiEi family antitoxin n=1 Tax=Adlercreutzia shanghongiae TaxID=3111773 RepID=A0ABU6J1J0_9ACTN|nr:MULTISPECIES: type IV toxin-antitoxin system AbiEi family antitoxin [unclassified Adlercreutzia]MEC4273526.1 type IV toxin-antitoxin system AbiEi family antitoxin [Adlercreutzia sp. R25]MEC4296001.1 type IV toxin-antitoxin system AbiEi family antitoxin [Adlercreutzia sp. R22]